MVWYGMSDPLSEVLEDEEVHEELVKALKEAALEQPLGFYAKFVGPRAQKLAPSQKDIQHATMTPAEEAARMDELTDDYTNFIQKQKAETVSVCS